MHVPAEGRKLHDQHHLCARYVDQMGISVVLAVDVVDRHVAHEEDKTDPWHEPSIDVVRYRVGSGGADEQRAYAIPEVEETDEVEAGHEDYEEVLLVGFVVRYAFQKAC